MMKGALCLAVMGLMTLGFLIAWNVPGFMGFASATYVSWKNYVLKKKMNL